MLKIIALFTTVFCMSVNAYPGLDNKQHPKTESRVQFVSILPEAYPLDIVSFKDAKGQAVDFSQYQGKVLMVNMWATWCPPCVRELPAIKRLANKFNEEDFVVLPISIDRDGKKQVEPFLSSMGMEDFKTFYDKEQELGAIFPLDTIPATFILNQKGELLAYVRTFVDWDDKEAEELISNFLKKD